MRTTYLSTTIAALSLLTACHQQPETQTQSEQATYADEIRLAEKYGVKKTPNPNAANARINLNAPLPFPVSVDSLEALYKRSSELEKLHKQLLAEVELYKPRIQGKSQREQFAILEEYPAMLKASIDGAGGREQYEKQKADAIAADEKFGKK